MSAEVDEPPVDTEPALLLVRPTYSNLFRDLSLSDAVEMSIEGTLALKRDREGFTYGETSLASVLSVMKRIDLAAHYPGGAQFVDLGSGIGNVVVGVALLSAAGALSGRISAITGVELLQPLHAAAERAVSAMISRAPSSSAPSLPLPLPPCSVICADIADFDMLHEMDVVYMASTVFENSVMTRFTERAAEVLRPNSRVITLHEPLKHDAFVTEAMVACANSWGDEQAFINVKRAASAIDLRRDDFFGGGTDALQLGEGLANPANGVRSLVAYHRASDGRTEWRLVETDALQPSKRT